MVMHNFLGQIVKDTDAALNKVLKECHAINVFVTMTDLFRSGRLTITNAYALDADFELDGEPILFRRRVGTEIVYYEQDPN
jgi:hypothetical protein